MPAAKTQSSKPAAKPATPKSNAPSLPSPIELDSLEKLLAAEQIKRQIIRAEGSLLEFARQLWHVLEPGRTFVEGWHIVVICLHLEALAVGKIRRLIINMPPRHMKTLLCSVLFPLWVWLKRPNRRFIVASYELPLSYEFADKERALLRSPYFEDRWGKKIALSAEQDAKSLFSNTATGYRYSTAVKAGGTGRGADIAIIDDPHNTKKVESDADRAQAKDFYHSVLNTRGNDPKDFSILIVGQRTHEDDLSGHLQEKADEGFEVLCLPHRYDGERRRTSLGEYDPRTVIGEPLWPERYDDEELKKLESTLGPYRASAQLAQKPAPPGGSLFKRDDILIEEEAPEHLELVRGWDIAATEESADSDDPDYTAGVLLGRSTDEHLWVTDVVEERTETPDLLIIQQAKIDGVDIPIAVELQPGAAGKVLKRSLEERLVKLGFTVNFYASTGNKVVRASSWAGVVREKRFHVLARGWTGPYVVQLGKFWQAAHDDMVDGTSVAYESMLTHGGGWTNGGGGNVTADDLSKLPGLRSGR